MINLYNEVPLIYSNTSRDFQYLSWLINIVLNDVKHNIDSMYDLPNIKTDTRLVELLALTLGFKIKRNYDQKQLIALVSIIPSLLKYKGTITAIIMAANALIKSSGATGRFDYEISNNNVVLLFPKELVDISLFNDLLPYILPAGMTCRIIRDTQTETDSTTQIGTLESIKFDWVNDISWDEEHQTTAGLSGLFDSINSSVPNFAKQYYHTSSRKTYQYEVE